MASIRNRLAHAWNAFVNKDEDYERMYKDKTYEYMSTGYSVNPYRPRLTRGNDRSIVNAIYNRIAIDVSKIVIKHVVVDDNNRFLKTYESNLNYCLTEEANKDQSSRDFIRDVVISLLDEGVVAIVPTEATQNPRLTLAFRVTSMRTGKILEWYPDQVLVRVYNDKTGLKEDILLPKRVVAIIENPLYYIMNERNSTLQRLTRKLTLLDVIDEQSGSGKLDMLIRLPYTVRTPAKKAQAESRREDIEQQLNGSKYGIAYIDATESVTQLNRPVENNIMTQVEYLTRMLYGQLGIDESVMNGTASDSAMLNYYNRTVEPIITAIVDAIRIKFLTKTARAQKQSVMYFRNAFALVPTTQMAELADKFTRNEILTSNELRQILGYLPSDDPKADELRNKNMPTAKEDVQTPTSNDELKEEISDQQTTT